jgi:hypothetical protein
VNGGNANRVAKGFCIFIDSVCEGRVPVWRDGAGAFVVFKSKLEAQREIADDLRLRLGEFLAGQRDFEDAIWVEDYVLEVSVGSDGSIVDGDGNVFKCVAE